MNKSILLGRITKAPEIRLSQKTNTKVASFTLAVNRKYVAQGEERQADFINIVAYSKLAEFVETYLRQGLQICVCGRIQTRTYEDNNGQKRYITEIIAEEIDFADSLKKQQPDERILYSSTTESDNNTKINNTEETEGALVSDDLPF